MSRIERVINLGALRRAIEDLELGEVLPAVPCPKSDTTFTRLAFGVHGYYVDIRSELPLRVRAVGSDEWRQLSEEEMHAELEQLYCVKPNFFRGLVGAEMTREQALVGLSTAEHRSDQQWTPASDDQMMRWVVFAIALTIVLIVLGVLFG